ncbi:type II 3-dehydroquinate dehydratase [Bosea sp. SSUT16]|jgi:3-dehydroquinate dehydratase-2|uniref:3-dehydroquinate dehydratase n=1 Tax=Bosea spartocytisi TaxID=2773451 RepID=A0A927I2A6_9HYPH|nr:type II 3-dehydroquinate dehydratase [Bosea spartocytisi]MBD3848307.1 type II 3-dehydroquinate dehydratase [Bosea spartocytisi]MCT4474774.1 type II 3-dehydroquinate dehydratase [Bosea spartocytisi]
MRTIFILNGPNLNLLGQREPEIYGRTTLDEIRGWCETDANELGLAIDFRQSNFEGEIIEAIHAARKDAAGIIINPAGYTFTSIAILDALKMFDRPKIELHISNIHQREAIYHNSLVSKTATAVIAGLGAYGYRLALRAMAELTR